MAFNWEDFAAGFLQQTNIELDERSAEAEALKREQKAEARRNAPLVQQRKSRARQAAQLGSQAKALGATDAQLAVALNSGVAGIQDFTTKLQQAASQRGIKTLSKFDIEAIIDMPDIPSVDMSYEDMVQQVYGARPTQAEVQGETPFWAQALGLTAVQDAERELATDTFSQGMTIQQINDMAASSEYSKIAGMEGSFVNYLDTPFFDSPKALDFVTTMSKTISAVEESRGFTDLNYDLEQRVKRGEISSEDASEKLASYVAEAANLETSLIGMGDAYKSSFFTNPVMQKFFEDYLPEGMLDRVSKPYTTPQSVEDSVAEDVPAAVSDDVASDVAKAGEATVPEVTTTELKDETNFEPLTTEEKALINKRLGMFAIFSDPEDKYVEDYTREQWKKMKRSERKRLGLPESALGGKNIYFRDEIQEILDDGPKESSLRKNFNQTRYKVKVRGKIGAFHVTKEQFEAMDDKWFEGDRPELTAEVYEDDEDNVKKLTSKLMKRYTTGAK